MNRALVQKSMTTTGSLSALALRSASHQNRLPALSRYAGALSALQQPGNHHHQQQQYRSMSYVLDGMGGARGGGGSAWTWPVRKRNTIFNIVPQGYKYVVERFGKLHQIQDSGYFLAVPFVDSISYVIDIRERAMDIPPQAAITRDNVSVEVSGNLFVKFRDAEAAAYGALNPLYSVTQVRYIVRLFLIFFRFKILEQCLILSSVF